MYVLRSILFSLVMGVVTLLYGLLGTLLFWCRPRVRHRVITSWAPLMQWFTWHLLGIRYRLVGQENLPAGPAVILPKHQSAWETIAFQKIFPPLCFVLKRELLRIPFFGWGLGQVPGIAIDRAAAKDALTQLIAQGSERLGEGYWIVVFPEGTRVAPGASRRYKSGGALLAVRAGVPVVPVAHNAGEFWPRNAFFKRPGEVTVSIGPVIDSAGKKAEEISAEAERWIEAEMRRLFPHHYQDGKAARMEDAAQAD